MKIVAINKFHNGHNLKEKDSKVVMLFSDCERCESS